MPYGGEEFELALALRAGAGGQDDQGLRAVLGERDLGVDVDRAEGGWGIVLLSLSRSLALSP